VAEDGTFSVVRTMLDGSNTFTVSVTDAFGNTNTTAEYSVNYEYKRVEPPGPETTTISPSTYAIWILVIALALFITAVVVTRMLRRDQE
jgi:beta-lactamase regulating signal transducer with metallopeptidase domain